MASGIQGVSAVSAVYGAQPYTGGAHGRLRVAGAGAGDAGPGDAPRSGMAGGRGNPPAADGGRAPVAGGAANDAADPKKTTDGGLPAEGYRWFPLMAAKSAAQGADGAPAAETPPAPPKPQAHPAIWQRDDEGGHFNLTRTDPVTGFAETLATVRLLGGRVSGTAAPGAAAAAPADPASINPAPYAAAPPRTREQALNLVA